MKKKILSVFLAAILVLVSFGVVTDMSAQNVEARFNPSGLYNTGWWDYHSAWGWGWNHPHWGWQHHTTWAPHWTTHSVNWVPAPIWTTSGWYWPSNVVWQHGNWNWSSSSCTTWRTDRWCGNLRCGNPYDNWWCGSGWCWDGARMWNTAGTWSCSGNCWGSSGRRCW